jgi:two-component system, OmpR family, phosphate regulon sensor histidine kinase PhoR
MRRASSLARSTRQGGRISLVLAFVFPAMIAAALALAYLGYQGAQNVVALAQKQFNSNASAQARDVTNWLTLRMDGEVNRLFSALSGALENPALPDAGKCAAELSLPVEMFAIYRQSPNDPPVCTSPHYKSANLKKLITDTHTRHFEWPTVPVALLKYVHVNKDNLFVVTRYQSEEEQVYFLVAKLNVSYILSSWLEGQVRRLGEVHRVAVIDEKGMQVPEMMFGGGVPLSNERFLYDEPLGRQLYAFSLRIAPNEETMRGIEKDIARQRVIRPLLVGLATIIIAVGMGIVLTSVITERRTSRLKSDFIANVSHELKTPLSLIRMFGEMVATGRHKGEETAREYGSIITRESERLSHLIDNVLDFARLERGKASYDFAEGDLAAVLERALDVCRYRLEKERLKLRTRVERHLPQVRMDENALTLVILNLVDNAVKYGADGGVVEVTLDRVPGGVSLSVRDYGPGIPAEEQLRIFERFYRAQSARDRNVRGSGIGLALVRHIAEAHGGHVSVESPVPPVRGGGVGSLFRVYLPSTAEAVAAGPPAADTPVEDIVSDEQMSR